MEHERVCVYVYMRIIDICPEHAVLCHTTICHGEHMWCLGVRGYGYTVWMLGVYVGMLTNMGLVFLPSPLARSHSPNAAMP